MWYCFIREDLDFMQPGDPLEIQSTYAKAINRFLMIDISSGNITSQNNAAIDVVGETLCLRGSCEFFTAALRLLQQKGCDLLEWEDDVQKIMRWELLQLTKRKVVSMKSGDMLSGRFSEDAQKILRENEVVFIKSREKGFSAKVLSSKVTDGDQDIARIINKHCSPEMDILLSEPMNIRQDSIGKKESRSFIRNNRILNASRPIHSLAHTVPMTLMREAERIVSHIATMGNFPCNYVLDLALVERDGEITTDIIEFNPFGTSMCYVNNSVFTEGIPGLLSEQNRSCYGYEYQLDMQRNPGRYKMKRNSGEKFTYISSEQYEFL